MDSLTQIVLGAACGELVLGKKLGNKAILLGAIGGTIPDLDVFVGSLLFDKVIDKEAFHRSITHSILFAVIVPFFLAWLCYFWNRLKKKRGEYISYIDWYWAWFLSIFTHPILDSFTAFGTQLFYPFSHYRVALSNISIVDFFYTIPFLLSIIILMFYKRKSMIRRKILYWGIGISSVYMLFTGCNKLYMDTQFEKTLANEGIKYQRLTTMPELFTNILWIATAETETDFYTGYYSWFDSQKIQFKKSPKNHQALGVYANDPTIRTFDWFTSGFYSVETRPDGYFLNYVRYGCENFEKGSHFLFGFKANIVNNRIELEEFDPMKNNMTNTSFWDVVSQIFSDNWERIKGN